MTCREIFKFQKFVSVICDHRQQKIPFSTIMTTVRSHVLVRSLTRTVLRSQSPILYHSPSQLLPCARSLSSLQPRRPARPSCRPSYRFYSTTPPEDFKIYTFQEVMSHHFYPDGRLNH